MENMPKDIEKYLTRDEIVEKHFNLKGCKVYASNKRLFLKKRNTVRDIDYNHISSIEFKTQRIWVLVLGGIFLILVALIDMQLFNLGLSDYSWILLVLGLVLSTAGFLIKKERVVLTVVGLSEGIPLRGQREELDSLFKLIREKRV